MIIDSRHETANNERDDDRGDDGIAHGIFRWGIACAVALLAWAAVVVIL